MEQGDSELRSLRSLCIDVRGLRNTKQVASLSRCGVLTYNKLWLTLLLLLCYKATPCLTVLSKNSTFADFVVSISRFYQHEMMFTYLQIQMSGKQA